MTADRARGGARSSADATHEDPVDHDDGRRARRSGNLALGGISNAYAEWNAYIDPHAVNVVFRSGAPVTLVPLDATRFVPMTTDVANRLGRSRSASFVRQLIDKTAPLGAVYFWDPLAAAIVVDPKIAAYAGKRLAVLEKEGPQSGRVVERKDGARVRTAISAKRPRFEETFAAALR